MEKQKTRRGYLFVTVFVANLLALTLGMTLAWPSPVIPKLEKPGGDNPLPEPLNQVEISLIGSLLPLGGIVGPTFVAYASGSIGRRWTMISIGIPFLVGFLMLTFATHVNLFFVARAFAGLSVGAAFTMIPNYLTEISDVAIRGTVSSSMNVVETSGEMLSQIIGTYMPMFWFNLTCAIIVAVYLILFTAFAPETPQYLLKIGKINEAKVVLSKLRGRTAKAEEVDEMRTMMATEASMLTRTFFQKRSNVSAVLIMCWLMFFQQSNGINYIVTYAQTIFIASDTDNPEIGPMAMGAAQVVTCFFTPLLIDRFGRKFLLVTSAAIMCFAEATLGVFFILENTESVGWLPMFCMLTYMAGYGFGFCAVPWVIMAELLPSNVSASASAFACGFSNLLSFTVTQSFPFIKDAVGYSGAFWIFAVFNVITIAYVVIWVPETKGKTVFEIEKLLTKARKITPDENEKYY